jgi:hypothetical protein
VVDLSECGRETARIVSDQGHAVRVGRKHGEFIVATGLAVPQLAV